MQRSSDFNRSACALNACALVPDYDGSRCFHPCSPDPLLGLSQRSPPGKHGPDDRGLSDCGPDEHGVQNVGQSAIGQSTEGQPSMGQAIMGCATGLFVFRRIRTASRFGHTASVVLCIKDLVFLV